MKILCYLRLRSSQPVGIYSFWFHLDEKVFLRALAQSLSRILGTAGTFYQIKFYAYIQN